MAPAKCLSPWMAHLLPRWERQQCFSGQRRAKCQEQRDNVCNIIHLYQSLFSWYPFANSRVVPTCLCNASFSDFQAFSMDIDEDAPSSSICFPVALPSSSLVCPALIPPGLSILSGSCFRWWRTEDNGKNLETKYVSCELCFILLCYEAQRGCVTGCRPLRGEIQVNFGQRLFQTTPKLEAWKQVAVEISSL